MSDQQNFGNLLRQWRQRRRLSQLELANNTDISTKHLSFLENGRAAPSREMIARLAENLQLPLRQRNILFHAGGYAHTYPARAITDPKLQIVSEVVQSVLTGHEPNPAMAVDHHWNIVAMNRPIQTLIQHISPALLESPANAMRIALHPDGLAPNILNFSEWRSNAIRVIKRRLEATDDSQIARLLDEVMSYQYSDSCVLEETCKHDETVIPFQLATPKGPINLITTTMTFGFPKDATVSELAIECLFPSDKTSAALLQELVREV